VDPFHLSQHLKAIKYHKKIQEKQSAVTKTDVTILINYFFCLILHEKICQCTLCGENVNSWHDPGHQQMVLWCNTRFHALQKHTRPNELKTAKY